jgi:hypothetical protein
MPQEAIFHGSLGRNLLQVVSVEEDPHLSDVGWAGAEKLLGWEKFGDVKGMGNVGEMVCTYIYINIYIYIYID